MQQKKPNPFIKVEDPVCKMQFPLCKAAAEYEYNSVNYYFCNIKCKEKFAADPEKYLAKNSVAESCCCCAAAMEDDEKKSDDNRRKLLIGFTLAAGITLIMAILRHCSAIPLFWNNILQALLATVVVFGPGGFLLARGVKSLHGLKLNMFTLISMGIASAYFYSIYALFFASALHHTLLDDAGNAKLHFVPAAMITALVILGQYLEARATASAVRAVRSLMELVPPTARRIKKCCGTVEDVPLDQVKVGDWLKVLAGDKIPVDGIVREGFSTVDESMLTGEAVPIEKNIGSFLAAGTVNGSGVLIMEARQVGSNTLIARIAELVRTARKTRLPVQNLADKAAAIFIPAVLAVALAALLIWGLLVGNWPMAMSSFIAVLLVACPCSLGLAAPLAVTVGIGVGARNGILIKNPAMLQTLRKVDTLMLDKTGTLTDSKLQIKAVICCNESSRDEFMQILFALEANSNHPFAQSVKAMKEYKKYCSDLPQASNIENIPGQGICGWINGQRCLAGSMAFLQKNSVNMQNFALAADQSGGSQVLLARGTELLGAVIWGDVVLSEAAGVIAELKKQKIDPVILSGDNFNAVSNIARSLDIEEFYAALSPADKLAKVKARQAFGRCVAMVGDGVNDTAALAAADVNIAMGSGTDAALENAGITLLNGNIGKLATLFELSRAVNENIKQNLLLAFAYNIILIPAAAGVFYNLTHWQFSPVLGSIAMSGSCLLVVGNALRLWLLNLNKKAEL